MCLEPSKVGERKKITHVHFPTPFHSPDRHERPPRKGNGLSAWETTGEHSKEEKRTVGCVELLYIHIVASMRLHRATDSSCVGGRRRCDHPSWTERHKMSHQMARNGPFAKSNFHRFISFFANVPSLHHYTSRVWGASEVSKNLTIIHYSSAASK